MSVNERLREQLAFLQAQNTQFRLIMGVLVHRLGGSATVSGADFADLQQVGADFHMTPRPGAMTDDGKQLPDSLEMKVFTGDEAKKAREEQQRRIEIAKPSLIIPGR